MPYHGDLFAQGCYYHVFNRGANRDVIFFNPGNYSYCLRLAGLYSRKYGISVIAHCLMPNHYHFLLRQDTDTPASDFIRVLFNAYVQAVNIQQKRTGTLFGGRFRHILIDCEEYLTHLCRYIHLNPVVAQLVSRPEDWPHSDYCEWMGGREYALSDRHFIQEHFANPQAYEQFVVDYIREAADQRKLSRYMLD